MRAKYFFLLILLVLASGVFFFYFSQENLTRLHFDALEYAQIARNIIRGKGICVNSYPPMGLVLLKETDRLSTQDCWPNFNRYLLTAVLLVPYFKLFGISLATMFAFFITWFFISIIIFYFLVNKLFGLRVAFFAVLFYIFTFRILNHALFGALELLNISLFCLFIYLIYKPKHHYYYYLAAFVFGLSYLNRYANLFFLPLILFYLYVSIGKKRIRLKTLVLFGVIFLFTISPLLVYNLYYAHSPFFSLQTSGMVAGRTSLYPNQTMTDREFFILNPFSFVLQHPQEMVKKFFLLIREALPRFLDEFMGSPHILFLAFLFILFYKSSNSNLKRIEYLILAMFFLNLLIYSLFAIEVRYFTLFIPFVLAFGLAFVLSNRFRYQYIFAILILILHTLPLISYLESQPRKAGSVYTLSNYLYIKGHTSEQDFILGPDRQIGWFADRKSIPAPADFQDLEKIQKEYLPVQGIYLCPEGFPHPDCADLKKGTKSIPGFDLKQRFDSGGLYFERVD